MTTETVNTPIKGPRWGLSLLCDMLDVARPIEAVGNMNDDKFVQLLRLRTPMQQAVEYVPHGDLDALDALDQQREQATAAAFQAASLPRALVAFRSTAIEHGMFKELPMINNMARSGIKLGSRTKGFEIVYANGNNELEVTVYSKTLLSNTPMISFSTANPHSMKRDESPVYTLGSVNVNQMSRGAELLDAMRVATVNAANAETAAHRKNTLCKMQQRSY